MPISPATTTASEPRVPPQLQPEPENFLGYNNSPDRSRTNSPWLSSRVFIVLTVVVSLAIALAIAALALLH